MSGNFEMDLGTERVEVRRVETSNRLRFAEDFGINMNTLDEVMSDESGYVVMRVKPVHRSPSAFKSDVAYALARVETGGAFEILTLRAVREPWEVLMNGVNRDETDVLRAFPDSFEIVDRYNGDVYEYMEDAKASIERFDPYGSFAGDLLLVELYMLVLDRIAEQSRGFGG